jgi:hypothetical protein
LEKKYEKDEQHQKFNRFLEEKTNWLHNKTDESKYEFHINNQCDVAILVSRDVEYRATTMNTEAFENKRDDLKD